MNTENLHEAYYYSGDVNLEHGGLFVKPDAQDYSYGYLECVRVTPCCEYPVYYVESLVALVDKDRIKDGMQCCGWEAKDILAVKGAANKRCMIAECLIAYGHYDPASCGYQHYATTVALNEDKEDIPEHITVDTWIDDIDELEQLVTCEKLDTGYVK